MQCQAANKPITAAGGDKDNTIFVDLVERLTLVFNRHASVSYQHISGSIQVLPNAGLGVAFIAIPCGLWFGV